jgi:signal transduction histidine kinase
MIKILVINDKKDNLPELEKLLLEAFPHHIIITSTSGKDGIKKAKSESPDVILLDNLILEKDRIETCRELKADILLKSIPVILLTNEGIDSKDRAGALNSGAAVLLSKPVDKEELTAQVSAMLMIKQSESVIREENRINEQELIKSYNDLELSKLATLNLLEDIKSEMEQRRQIEEEVKKLNTELEKRVTKRTNQLEAANRELEAFAYSVSHDLRAPLRAIDGFSKFVLEDYGGKLDPEGKRLLGLIRSNTRKMDQLITDILALSRVTRSEHKLSKVDMTKMALSMVSETSFSGNPKKTNISVDTMPDALADSTYIKQVWINLISNAIKFSSTKEKPVITIGGYTEKEFNIYFVKDNGVGFNSEYSHKLFGVFQRLHRVDEFEGTGVGLAIVQRIILRHGGKVWAEGEEGKGASFYFSLPVRD